jgi:hypothetical protein
MSWTQVSFSKLDEQIGSHLWKKVWRAQLHLVSEEDFWAGLDGRPVRFDLPPTPQPPEAMPAYLEHFLGNGRGSEGALAGPP